MNLSDSLENVADTNVYGVFMQPVGKYKVKNHAKFKTIIMQYIAELDGSKLENKHPTISVNVSQLGDHQILELPEFRELKNEIKNAVNEVNKQSFCYELTDGTHFADSYLELGQQGALYAPHEHSNCIYSGTYYVNFDRERHTMMKFRRNIISSHYPILQVGTTQMNAFNQLDCTVPYDEGDIIIHPPNLQHGYEGSGHANRITLTFNVSP